MRGYDAPMDGVGRVNGLVIDGHDTFALARFWGAMFATEVESVANDGQYVDLMANDRAPLLRFQRVPERKQVKNRLHLDIDVDDVPAAMARVREIGGSIVQDVTQEFGYDFAIVADPEGNEFCLIRTSDGPT
jgi:predicted enzyme related to lactoylglutathione lyase